MADPGFPVGGGRGPRRGVDPRGGYVSKILYVETKESGPLGGGGVRGASANIDPPMVIDLLPVLLLWIFFNCHRELST